MRSRLLFLFVPLALFCLSPLSIGVKAQVDVDRVIFMGRSALYFDDYVSALRFFSQAINARPHSATPYYFRAYTKFTLEDYAGAEEDCSAAIARNKYYDEVYLLRGLCRIRRENYQGAADDYGRVLVNDPDNQGARYNRALCFAQVGNYEDADDDLDFLQSRYPRFNRVHLAKAHVAMMRHDTLRALNEMDKALAVNPMEGDAWAFKGRYAIGNDDFEAADTLLGNAIRCLPNDIDNYLVRAIARYYLDNYTGALDDYDYVIAHAPQHLTARYNRAILRAELGDDNCAIEDLDTVLAYEPNDVLATYNRALLREKTGNYRGADEDLTRILDEFTGFTYGYAARARCRRALGNTQGAIADETRVARAEWDMRVGVQRDTAKNVRRAGDRNLENYSRLIAEEDTAVSLLGAVFGKVQNRHVEQEALPQYALFIARPGGQDAPPGFLPEMNALAQDLPRGYRLYFAAQERTPAPAGVTAEQLASPLLRSALAREGYDYDEALTWAEQAVRADTASILALLQRATILAEKHLSTSEGEAAVPSDDSRYKTPPLLLLRAVEDVSQAIAIDSLCAYAYYNRACILACLDRRQEALADFSKVVELDERLPEAYYNRALLYIKEGDNDSAASDLSHAGELGLYKAYNLLKQLRP